MLQGGGAPLCQAYIRAPAIHSNLRQTDSVWDMFSACYIRRWAVTAADCDWGLLCESRRTVATPSQQTGGGLCVCKVGSSPDTKTFHKQAGENRKRWYIPWSVVYTLREEETIFKYKLLLRYVVIKCRKSFDLYHPLGRRNIQLHFQPRSKHAWYWQYIWA